MSIPHEPDREGEQDKEASQAYDRTSRWPIFKLERQIVAHRLAKLKPQGRLVDIGCGPGYLAAEISRRYPALGVIGLDNNHEMINIARRNWPSGKYELELVEGDAGQLPFADNSLDFAVSSLSLHHWKQADRVFAEIHRVLKPGGQFLVLDLRRDGSRLFYYALRLVQRFSPAAIRRTNGAVGSFWASYTPSELKTMLSSMDFDRVCIETHFGWMIISIRKPENS
jgi:ubiquinone/menaquinone biosynthesis C-methylase UbiE